MEQSNETAREWYMKAAEQGQENAIGALQELDKEKGRTTASFVLTSCHRPHDPPEHKLRPCAKCHRAFYCGKECQLKHWKREAKWAQEHVQQQIKIKKVYLRGYVLLQQLKKI